MSRKISKLGKFPTPAKRNKITEQQNRLLCQINKFNEDAKLFISISEDDENNDNEDFLPTYDSDTE